ncbi:MAG TPA: Calx-beta domain-containing protein [Pyrinomonadaceae bacterium]|nr:Calx-beta domain-containing protein [Pyrinomonadaceae bacterium]
MTEGDADTNAATFTLTLSAASEQEVSVEVAVRAGTAALYTDFQPVSGEVVIAPGRTFQIITVPVVGENVFETDETFTLEISNPVNAVIADGQGIGTIFNDDSRPTVSVAQTSVMEGNSGTRNIVFGLSLSNASYEQVQVQYATVDGTAAAGSDYVAASGTVVFNPGTLNATAAAVVNGDTQVESNETLFVKLAQPINATIANGLSMGIIYNDDGAVVRLSARDYLVNEGDGRVTLTVTRSGDPSAFSIDYQTLDNDTFTAGCSDQVNNRNSAYARCDFATVAGTLDFAAGENSETITVPIIDDSFVEGNETFWVYLINQEGAAIGTPSFSTVTVRDNDTATAAPNPIFTNEFFVRQQYLDFLSREPDAGGFQAWLGVLAQCPDSFAPPHVSSRCDRIFVSGEGFFRSQEFQLKGFYVFRFYQLAFQRLPEYSEIVADMSFVAGATPAEVYARKARLAHSFTLRPEFLSLYGELTNAQYVAALLGRYELGQVTTPDPAAPDAAA